LFKRLYLAGALLLGAVFAFVVSWWLFQQRSQQLNEAFDSVRRIEVAMLQLRRREKDFLLRGERRYIDDFARERDHLRRELGGLAGAELLGAAELRQLERHLDDYVAGFNEVVARTLASSELRAKLHGKGERLAAELAAGDPDRRRQLAELRLQERELGQRGRRPDWEWFDRAVGELDEENRPENAAVKDYAAAFITLSRELEALGLDEDSGAQGRMRTAVHRLEAGLGEQRVQASRSLDTARERVVVAMLGTSLLFLLVLGASVLYIRRLFHAQEALRVELAERAEEQRVVLSSIGDGLITTDTQGKVTGLNPAAELLTGWTEELARGKPIADVFVIVNAKTREPATIPVAAVLETGKIQGLANDTLLIAKDGVERQIADSAAPLMPQAGELRGVVMVFRDVTERYDFEARQRQSQKLESIGLLAGGVAHDFNNMLGAILTAAQLLEDDVRDPEQKKLLGMIYSSARNAASLTRKLLSFSRQGKLVSSPLDVHQVLDDTLVILSRTLDKRIGIEKRLAASEALVVGDPAQLQNAFLNLGINAGDAMPQGGAISVTTRNVELDGVFCKASTFDLAVGPYLEIVFTDSGVGMDAATLARIFDPFFTTKEHERGTGLGLASVYGAIKEHRGAIEVKSSPGQGSQFRLLFPLAEERGVVVKAVEPVRSALATILVVDDEQIVRTTTRMILERHGHRVLEAENGTRAIELFRQRAAEIELVVLDMVMPDLHGPQVARALSELKARTPILFISGFTPDRVDLEGDGPRGFVHKPFGKDELVGAVERLLSL
jgi:PAS domain S-box-containing protein